MVLFCMGCVEVIREIVLSLNDHDDNNDHVGDGEDNQIDDDCFRFMYYINSGASKTC